MSTSNFNLKNVPPDVMSSLKREAKKQKTSINSLKSADRDLEILGHNIGDASIYFDEGATDLNYDTPSFGMIITFFDQIFMKLVIRFYS